MFAFAAKAVRDKNKKQMRRKHPKTNFAKTDQTILIRRQNKRCGPQKRLCGKPHMYLFLWCSERISGDQCAPKKQFINLIITLVWSDVGTDWEVFSWGKKILRKYILRQPRPKNIPACCYRCRGWHTACSTPPKRHLRREGRK